MKMASGQLNHNGHCLVCSAQLNLKKGKTYNIFDKANTLPYSGDSLSAKLSNINGKIHKMGQVSSDTVCNKCYKLVEAVDGLEWSIHEHKKKIVAKFKRSLQARKRQRRSSEKQLLPTEIKIEELDEALLSANAEQLLSAEGLQAAMNGNCVSLTGMDAKKDDGVGAFEAASNQRDFEIDRNLGEELKTVLIDANQTDAFSQLNAACNGEGSSETESTKEGVYCCPHCSKVFPHHRHFKSHILSVHSDVHSNQEHAEQQVLFPCKVCSKSFFSKEACNLHELQHSSDQSYECALCGQNFEEKPSLLNHLVSVHHVEGNDDFVVVKALDEEISINNVKDLSPVVSVQEANPISLVAEELRQKSVSPAETDSQNAMTHQEAGEEDTLRNGTEVDLGASGGFQYVLYSGAIAPGQDGALPGGLILLSGTPDQQQQLLLSQHVPADSQFVQLQLPNGYVYAQGSPQ